MLKYRTTPHPIASTGETPSKLMFGREIKTRLHMLHPDAKETPKQQTTALAHTRKLESADPVWIRNYSGKPKWIAGKVISKTGPVSYKVKVQGQVQQRHIDQLKKRLVDTKLTSQLAESNMTVSSYFRPHMQILNN